jgi:hypothetical protein
MTPAPVRMKTVAGMAAVGRTIVSLTTVGGAGDGRVRAYARGSCGP